MVNRIKTLLNKALSFFKFNEKKNSSFIFTNKKQQLELNKKFVKDDGSVLYIDDKYRWSTKQGWRYYNDLNILSSLKDQNLLNNHQLSFFSDCIGDNTIDKPLNEINVFVNNEIIHKNRKKFLFNEDGSYILLPAKKKYQHQINFYRKHYKYLFRELKNLDIKLPAKREKFLEVGYESGGHSIFALESLGFEAYGIDNGYSGLKDISFLPKHIGKNIGSSAKFAVGDITKHTEFPDKTFSFVNSVAVLEHIFDLPSAFTEMSRILKDDGLMIHSYDPYFHPAGGHALGILDNPWNHLCLNENEYVRYMKENRPHEEEDAISWYKHGINRSYPCSEMLYLLHKANFEVLYWRTDYIDNKSIQSLNAEIIFQASKNYQGLSFQDFISNKHTFIARKKISKDV